MEDFAEATGLSEGARSLLLFCYVRVTQGLQSLYYLDFQNDTVAIVDVGESI